MKIVETSAVDTEITDMKMTGILSIMVMKVIWAMAHRSVDVIATMVLTETIMKEVVITRINSVGIPDLIADVTPAIAMKAMDRTTIGGLHPEIMERII
jgi:hypothetical protein